MPTEKEVDGIREFIRALSEEFESYLRKIIREELQAELDRRDEVSKPIPFTP